MAAGKNRSTLYIVGAIVVVVVVAGIMLSGNFGNMFSMKSGTQTAAQTQGSTQQQTSTSSGTTSPTQNIGVTATATAQTTVAGAPAPKTVEVDFTGSFSPGTVTINKGDTVNFVNKGTQDIRVASNPHPIHTGYDSGGNCQTSTFDSCSNIAAGGNWSFTFTKTGTWGYHDHLNPGITGTVVVQ